MSVRAQKALGQHFLRDPQVAVAMAQLLNSGGTYQTIIEVGAGTGALTHALIKSLDKNHKLFLVEIDEKLATGLKRAFPDLRDAIIHADFLKLRLEELGKMPVAIIGNLPYNIASQILFKVIQNRQHVQEVICMVQKEVAERIVAKPSCKAYGIISVLVQAFYDVTYCFDVSPEAFLPRPRVTSAVIHLKRNAVQKLPCQEKSLFKVVKTGFQQRRKMLRNALRALNVPLDTLEETLLRKRAEELTVANFVQLTCLLYGAA